MGEERGSPVSLSWVVLPEPSPHASAEPSEVVQPELRLEAVTPPPGVPDPAAEPVVVTDARIRAEAMAAMRALAQTRTRTVRRVLDGARSLIMTHAPMLEVLGRLRADAPETQVAERPAPEQQQQAGPVADEGQRGPEPAPEAVESDREADAISTIEALVDLLGSDIASQGLTIKTAKPRYFHYTTIMTRPQTAIANIEFDERGKVAWVDIDPSSGVASVDEALRDVIHDKWTAEGAPIDRLVATPADDTVLVRIRIVF